MLLGNSISAISLSLDAITNMMVEEQHEIQELYLSFGATKWEVGSYIPTACWRSHQDGSYTHSEHHACYWHHFYPRYDDRTNFGWVFSHGSCKIPDADNISDCHIDHEYHFDEFFHDGKHYIIQSKVSIPGTPIDMMNRVASFHSWQQDGLSINEWVQDTRDYLIQWGLGGDALTKEWSALSGGEAQRVVVELALASRPKILLFDASTSALDRSTKIAVENSVKKFIHEHKGGASCWISHDMEQAECMTSFESEGGGASQSCSSEESSSYNQIWSFCVLSHSLNKYVS
jgi:ABC-type dipeptide/oligopeptide/nickel transport system ATPase subunit